MVALVQVPLLVTLVVAAVVLALLRMVKMLYM